MKTVFNRVEKKYLLTNDKYELLMKQLKSHLEKDCYSNSTICNIYFDTNHFDLIKRSIEKPIYKEKVRLRSYEVPTMDSTVFLEIKKKYKKIVNKRRMSLPLKEMYSFLENPQGKNQIEKEIIYAFQYYQLKPMMFIAYDRTSFYLKEDMEFRITFDQNIRYRQDNLILEAGDKGKQLLNDTYVMEIKSNFNYPLWFSHLLSELHIYPTSFSKYGTAYQNMLKEEIYV